MAMADPSWQKVREVFDAVLRKEPEERQDFLNQACGDNQELLSEVRSLLSSLEGYEEFLEEPAIAHVASRIDTDKRALAAGTRIGHYEIIRRLGSGGMGEVYLAKDQKLDRRVAIKILNERLSRDEANLRRFVREAKIASALNHPNILVIHEIGKSDGVDFIVSEFIDGGTLREVLKEKTLAVSDALDISIQIASALTAAQQAHLIHRDIKPENIMLRSDGYVKVLDFGLAKLIERETKSFFDLEDTTAQQNPTAKGVILGTVNYMSPEQAKGANVDGRSDIFSLGVVIYEMITGRTPFAGDSIAETFANLINAEPASLSHLAMNVPDELQRIVSKTLRKDKGQRYQTMKDLLAELQVLKRNVTLGINAASNNPAVSDTRLLAATTASGDPQATNTVRSFSHAINRHRALAGIGLTLLLAVSGLGVWWFMSSTAKARPVESIAVLPFINETGNSDVEYLSDGMTETLISDLSQLPNLDVKARSSVFRYKGQETNANAIAQELKVQAFLNGKVSQRSNDVSLYIELVDTQTEKAIWSQTYYRPMTNLVSLQREIARDVAEKLRRKLSGAEESVLTKNYTSNSEAYQLYLKGRFHLDKRTRPDIQKAFDHFQRSVSVDPSFALGYAQLAETFLTFENYSLSSQRETRPKAKEAVLKSLLLDPQLSQAHAVLGYILSVEGDLVEAERELQRAIELNPNIATTYHFYCHVYRTQGRFEEALVMQRRALELEPFSLIINREYGSTFFWARRYDEAIAQFKKTIDLDANFPSVHYMLALVHQVKGNYAESVEEHAKYQELIGEPKKAFLLRDGFKRGGWQKFLRTITDERHQFDLSWDRPVAYYAALGETDKAFALLSRAAETGANLRQTRLDPRLDSLRADPRYEELMKLAESK
jgi:eukaryotic-like serine/threonine-protein kinase